VKKLAVLAAPDSWYAADLMRAAAGQWELAVLPFSQLAATVAGSEHEATRISTAGDDLRRFEAVLVRTMPPGSLEQVVFRMDALGLLAASGTPVVNPPRALEVAIDKYLALAKLRAAGLRTPQTWIGQTTDEALVAWEQLGGDVVVKPLFGGEGRGIFRVSDPDLALRAFTTLERIGAVIYLQRFVPHSGHDLRLFVLGETVLGMKRENDCDWRTNVSRGARTEPLEVTEEFRGLALRASAAVGTLIAGVDLIPGRDGELYAIEVNAVPGWKALARTLNVDIAQRVLQFLDEQAV
jgi:ribosomal protein S6--L-glutamate ligase